MSNECPHCGKHHGSTVIPTTAINFLTLWVKARGDGTYEDRSGFIFPSRPAVDEKFQIGDREYSFYRWEYQDDEKHPKRLPYRYEFWHFSDNLD